MDPFCFFIKYSTFNLILIIPLVDRHTISFSVPSRQNYSILSKRIFVYKSKCTLWL